MWLDLRGNAVSCPRPSRSAVRRSQGLEKPVLWISTGQHGACMACPCLYPFPYLFFCFDLKYSSAAHSCATSAPNKNPPITARAMARSQLLLLMAPKNKISAIHTPEQIRRRMKLSIVVLLSGGDHLSFLYPAWGDVSDRFWNHRGAGTGEAGADRGKDALDQIPYFRQNPDQEHKKHEQTKQKYRRMGEGYP